MKTTKFTLDSTLRTFAASEGATNYLLNRIDANSPTYFTDHEFAEAMDILLKNREVPRYMGEQH